MVARYAETDFAIDFETASGCEEAERRGAERIRGWKDYATVVDAAGVR
jgi:hypothetical protein